jgi:pyridoxamine 5'-phosphate oxidase
VLERGVDAGRLADLRRAYADVGLSETDCAADPFSQFQLWLAEAVEAGLTEPNAMVLGTVGADRRPSARTVLLKGVDDRGFVFFTNYASRKGRELAAYPVASLLFPWYDLERQVAVSGEVSKVDLAETHAYFRSRPRGSQLGAWASRQSAVIGGRAGLEDRYAELAARWPREVPVPDFWGGLRVVPDSVEFWQGRPSRLHDRLRYVRAEPGQGWCLERLSP